MLKVEYPCREVLLSFQNQTKSIITWDESKKHLHDVRLRRQQQLATNINECHRLHTLHKQLYNRQFDSGSTEKRPDEKPLNPTSNDYSSHTKKYSLPRIEHAPIIYRKAIPTFELETSSKLESDTTIVKELTQYLTESSSRIPDDKIENRSLSPIRRPQQRRLSVSSVSSFDKRANKVYEKWPDYNQISEIVGYRIDPPPPKLLTANSNSSRPSGAAGQRKRNSSLKFSTAAKEIKTLTGIYPSPTRRQSLKTKTSTKTDATPPVIIDKLSPIIEKAVIHNPIKETKPKLPDILCPSSVSYSKRIQTRQWLMKHNFALNSIQTIPLL